MAIKAIPKGIFSNYAVSELKAGDVGYVISGRGVYVGKNNTLIRLKDAGWKHF